MQSNLTACLRTLNQHPMPGRVLLASARFRAETPGQPSTMPWNLGTTSSYHSGKTSFNAPDGKGALDVFFTDDMIAEMEYHHVKQDLTDLNLFLKHPATPKVMGWHPDLICDGDVTETLMGTVTQQTGQENPAGCDTSNLQDDRLRSHIRRSVSWSCMNRNARYGSKATKGKRPVSRQKRRNKKRSIGNHRR